MKLICELTLDDLQRKIPGKKWFNNHHIDNLSSIFNDMVHELQLTTKATILPTTFSAMLFGGRKDEHAVSVFINQARYILLAGETLPDLFQYDTLLLPTNIRNVHWISFGVKFKLRLLFVFDSMGCSFTRMALKLLNCLNDMHIVINGTPLPDLQIWRICNIGRYSPQQTNAYDCGPATVMAMLYCAMGKKFDYKQKHFQACRLKFTAELFSKWSKVPEVDPNLIDSDSSALEEMTE